jgi:hypothetical protein
MKQFSYMTALAGLYLASLTGFAMEPVFTQPVVNRWDVVKFELPPEIIASLDWPLRATEAPARLVPELRPAPDYLVPLEWPKEKKVTQENYAALSDWRVNIERTERVPGGKRERPDHSFGKVKLIRA